MSRSSFFFSFIIRLQAHFIRPFLGEREVCHGVYHGSENEKANTGTVARVTHKTQHGRHHHLTVYYTPPPDYVTSASLPPHFRRPSLHQEWGSNWRVFLCCLRKGRKRSRKARAETDVILVLRGRLPCWDCVCGCMSVCRGVGAAVVSKPPITVFYDHFVLFFLLLLSLFRSFVPLLPSFSLLCSFPLGVWLSVAFYYVATSHDLSPCGPFPSPPVWPFFRVSSSFFPASSLPPFPLPLLLLKFLLSLIRA